MCNGVSNTYLPAGLRAQTMQSSWGRLRLFEDALKMLFLISLLTCTLLASEGKGLQEGHVMGFLCPSSLRQGTLGLGRELGQVFCGHTSASMGKSPPLPRPLLPYVHSRILRRHSNTVRLPHLWSLQEAQTNRQKRLTSPKANRRQYQCFKGAAKE